MVAHPNDWPGLHCAESLATGRPIKGEWFDGTAYGTAFHRAKRRGKEADVRREDFVRRLELSFDPLPTMSDLSDEDYRREVSTLIDDIVSDVDLGGALGAARVCATDRMTRRTLPPIPWYEDRRRFVCWDNRHAPEVAEYVARYWAFQATFRIAANDWRRGEPSPGFPIGAFWPGRARPNGLSLERPENALSPI